MGGLAGDVTGRDIMYIDDYHHHLPVPILTHPERTGIILSTCIIMPHPAHISNKIEHKKQCNRQNRPSERQPYEVNKDNVIRLNSAQGKNNQDFKKTSPWTLAYVPAFLPPSIVYRIQIRTKELSHAIVVG